MTGTLKDLDDFITSNEDRVEILNNARNAYFEFKTEIKYLLNRFDTLQDEADEIDRRSIYYNSQTFTKLSLNDTKRMLEIHTTQGRIIERLKFIRDKMAYIEKMI